MSHGGYGDYVFTVPDYADRIVWRGNYYHLPLQDTDGSQRKEIARYRWLRKAGAWESEIGMGVLSEDPEKFDAAVDEAMRYSP